jgi:hypothetical protein
MEITTLFDSLRNGFGSAFSDGENVSVLRSGVRTVNCSERFTGVSAALRSVLGICIHAQLGWAHDYP